MGFAGRRARGYRIGSRCMLFEILNLGLNKQKLPIVSVENDSTRYKPLWGDWFVSIVFILGGINFLLEALENVWVLGGKSMHVWGRTEALFVSFILILVGGLGLISSIKHYRSHKKK